MEHAFLSLPSATHQGKLKRKSLVLPPQNDNRDEDILSPFLLFKPCFDFVFAWNLSNAFDFTINDH